MSGELSRAAARGLAAGIAMSVIRSLTTQLGLVRMTPPEEISAEGASPIFERIPAERRAAAQELAHWGYGILGSIAFVLLPRSVRSRPLTGPLYGVGTWALFEFALAPVLGNPNRERPASERAALLADHVVYGAIVGSGQSEQAPAASADLANLAAAVRRSAQ